ncbi:TRAP transporter substrate-binding protein [Thalassospira sp.]|uniref:TRAP transporter substrate-binding protein n=1 Tax=Thalassospira sp. TaxID=1912094 RepID=UPI002734C92E|nr:TRAP transporter substrate-binding protein [Thalassospira sp.]MDP2698577.1 TRAP transporter substrate-binding protein [Thalassospira sp.]
MNKINLPVLAALLGMGATVAHADAKFDMSSEYPVSSIHAQTADFFAKTLGEETAGAINVTVHHGGALGYKSVDHYDAVGDGAVQLASSFSGAWSGINPIFLVSSLPFLATSIDDTQKLYEVTRPYYEKALEADNQVFLYAAPWPASGFWANQPVETVEALKGLKIRTFDTPGTKTLQAAGASPVQLSWGDIVPQLTTNGIDAVLTSADGGAGSQFWEYLSDFTEVNYALPLQVTHMNRDAFDALSEEEQKAVLESAKKAEAYGWEALENRVRDNYAKLAEHKVTVTTQVSADLLSLLQTSSAPEVEQWKDRVGDDAQTLMETYQSLLAQ